MAERKKKYFFVEISDILESEQEEFVIEKVRGYVKKDDDELREYFKTTDTLEIRKLSEDEAKRLTGELGGMELTIKMYNTDVKREEKKQKVFKCPKCGYVLEFPDWRCPECYHEFPDYEVAGEEETEE